jgi:ubiquinone/menaquinone biosynthesis C-methylase UbiE
LDKALIAGNEEHYELTEQGRPVAEAYFKQRPDHYWYFYQQFYQTADASEAHSRFCARTFGLDLCQEGMTDMESVRTLIDLLQLEPGQRVLDLGCGAGGISEYLSERTGTHVTGIDYSEIAISTAIARTEGKRSRLRFLEADLNTLALPPASFDAAISIDSIYWVDDVSEALQRIARSLKPGGQLAIFIVHLLEYCDAPEQLEIDKTDVACALDELQLSHLSRDVTDTFSDFWPRVKESMLALKDEFEREGNRHICEHWLKEANSEFLPALEAEELRRYLYLARV